MRARDGGVSLSDKDNIIQSGEMWKLRRRGCCSACTKAALLWPLPRRQGGKKKGGKKTQKKCPASQPAWFGAVARKIKPQSISVRAADKQASLGFSQIKKARLPQSPRLAPMKQTPLLCERFRDGSILLFWALTSRSEGGYDSAACGEK